MNIVRCIHRKHYLVTERNGVLLLGTGVHPDSLSTQEAEHKEDHANR